VSREKRSLFYFARGGLFRAHGFLFGMEEGIYIRCIFICVCAKRVEDIVERRCLLHPSPMSALEKRHSLAH